MVTACAAEAILKRVSVTTRVGRRYSTHFANLEIFHRTIANAITLRRAPRASRVTGHLDSSCLIPGFDGAILSFEWKDGIKRYELTTWFGFGAPARTPDAILLRLRDEIAKVAVDPAVKSKLEDAGVESVEQTTPTDFATFIAADAAKWATIIKAAGAKVN